MRLLKRVRRRSLWRSHYRRGIGFAKRRGMPPSLDSPPARSAENPLAEYFESHTEGRGIWKWDHYFQIYHRHFAPFAGTSVRVLEIGIYSGGSLGMWRSYFGEDATIYGVDIEPACRRYAGDRVHVHIGDQADPAFWAGFFEEVGAVDIVIDDGGHLPLQQRVTFEAVYPQIRPGGFYVCEDIDGPDNLFSAYLVGLTDALNRLDGDVPSEFQAETEVIHFYPGIALVEKARERRGCMQSLRRGTQWEPFFD